MLLLAFCLVYLTPECLAQASRPDPAISVQLSYPKDKDKVMAKVDGRNITLHDLLSHLDNRHFPGLLELAKTKAGLPTLRSPLIATWIRQYADVVALETEARSRELDSRKVAAIRGRVFDEAFAKHLETYRRDYRRRMGKPFPTTESGIKSLQRSFTRRRGLGLEVEGWLNAFIPRELTQAEVDKFYRDYPEIFVGLIDVAHIFLQTRDPKTGGMYVGNKRKEVLEKVESVRRLLKKKGGSDFEEIAARFSDDRETRGSILRNVNRFDHRLPANMCRTAWGLKNGQFAGPIESIYGLHFVKRVTYHRTSMIVRLDPKNARVQRFVHDHKKEAFLYKMREAHTVTMLY